MIPVSCVGVQSHIFDFCKKCDFFEFWYKHMIPVSCVGVQSHIFDFCKKCDFLSIGINT
uniref:Uncharacterized protein n=1 Tax=Ciona intestinalis TaxID=7719 RepID=H2Y1T9_CIOIN